MRLFHVRSMLVAALALTGCALEDSAPEEGDEEVSTASNEIVLPLGNQGCDHLFRASSRSQNVYLAGCGGGWFGVQYRVPFNGFNVYFCFTGAGTQFVGQQGDLAGDARRMDNPVDAGWCHNGFPSVHSSGG